MSETLIATTTMGFESVLKQELQGLDLNDLKKYYLLLQKELQDINLNIKGKLNNRFCNTNSHL